MDLTRDAARVTEERHAMTMSMLPYFIIQWLILGVIVVGSLLAVIRAIVRPRGLKKGACCGRCRYAIASPIPERCPECGGSIHAVGLLTNSLAIRGPWRAVAACFGWAAICIVTAVYGFAFLTRHTGHSATRGVYGRWMGNISGPVYYTDPATNQPAELFRFEVTSVLDGFESGPARPGLVVMRLSDEQGNDWTYAFENHSFQQITSAGSGVRHSAPPSPTPGATHRQSIQDVIRHLAETTGRDPTDATVALVIDELSDQVTKRLASRSFPTPFQAPSAFAGAGGAGSGAVQWRATGGGTIVSGGSTDPLSLRNTMTFFIVLWSYACLLWLAGCALILWRRTCLVTGTLERRPEPQP